MIFSLICSEVAKKFDNELVVNEKDPRQYVVEGFQVKDANPTFNPAGYVVKELLFFDVKATSFTEVVFDVEVEAAVPTAALFETSD